mgnify:CR=1 FL=1
MKSVVATAGSGLLISGAKDSFQWSKPYQEQRMPSAKSDDHLTPPTPRAHFVHPLLRARDWQDRPEFAQVCDWWRGATNAEFGVRNAESARITPHSALCTPHSYVDSSRLPPLAEVKVPDEAAADDPRLAAVKEQERKFGRLAQRYRKVLAGRCANTVGLFSDARCDKLRRHNRT